MAGIDGYEAVLLWARHCRGDYNALPTLLTYNREDVINLETLMDRAFHMAQSILLGGVGQGINICTPREKGEDAKQRW